MSSCIEKLPHECGSSDALQVFMDDRERVTGYCFACDTYVPDPYDGEKPSEKLKVQKVNPEEQIEEINSLNTFDLPERKLTKDSLEYFGVKVAVSEEDGTTPIFVHYPIHKGGELVAYKTRFVPAKKFWSVGDIKQGDMFGWSRALQTGAKTLYITEGPDDAVALFQSLKKKSKGTKWEEYNPAVVSLRNGASAASKELSQKQSDIRKNFKEVVLVFDMDDAGKAATEAAMKVLPHARSVNLPEKDPNDCVIKGYEMALCNAVLFKADKPKNTHLIWARDVIDDARKAPEMGLSWPWEGLTKLTRGIRLGETIYLGAGVKMGKTTAVATLVAHLMTEHNMNVFLAQPEETNVKTVKTIVGKVAKRVFHDPDIPFDYDAYDKAAPLVADKLCMLNLYQNLDWTVLRGDIIEAVDQGCQAIFIDPITNITNGIDAAQANTVLQEFAQELAALAKDLNIVVFLFCHLKAPESGPPHERGGNVFSSQFAGSRAMMRSCHLMLGLEGNKDPDLPEEERNIRRLTILEDREFGATGYVTLFYEKNTGMFHEIRSE